MVTHNPVINETIYFDLFESAKTLSNNLDATCERLYMATSRDNYYTEMFKTLIDYNEHKNTPSSNENI